MRCLLLCFLAVAVSGGCGSTRFTAADLNGSWNSVYAEGTGGEAGSPTGDTYTFSFSGTSGTMNKSGWITGPCRATITTVTPDQKFSVTWVNSSGESLTHQITVENHDRLLMETDLGRGLVTKENLVRQAPSRDREESGSVQAPWDREESGSVRTDESLLANVEISEVELIDSTSTADGSPVQVIQFRITNNNDVPVYNLHGTYVMTLDGTGLLEPAGTKEVDYSLYYGKVEPHQSFVKPVQRCFLIFPNTDGHCSDVEVRLDRVSATPSQ